MKLLLPCVSIAISSKSTLFRKHAPIAAHPSRHRNSNIRPTGARFQWLGLAIFFSCLVKLVSAAQFGKFAYTDNGTSITITSYPDHEVGAVEIPASINGKPVTEIGQFAFADRGLTSISIPNSVTHIGWGAFYDSDDLTSVSIGSGVTSIDMEAFYSCDSLTSISIPDSVTSIGKKAFYSCDNLTSISIPDSVTSIGEGAFSWCWGLTSATIGSGVTSITYQAFWNCRNLISVFIPNSVIEIEALAFDGCESLTSVSIPHSVTTIGNSAFGGCYDLTSVSIPNSVTTIGHEAFYHCESLTSVSTPNSVTYIGQQAFAYCSGLTSVLIPNSVTLIGYGAFEYCTSLTRVSIGSGVTSIWDKAFSNCYRLTSVDIFGSAPWMGKNVFDGAHSRFMVFYQPENTGFTTPSWHGYPCSIRQSGQTEITVEQPPGTEIMNGGSKSFSSVGIGSSLPLTFTIKNTGNANLTGLAITKNGTHAVDFTVGWLGTTTVAVGSSTTFTVTFSPSASGSRTAAIHIASNDTDQNPFEINLTGTGLSSLETWRQTHFGSPADSGDGANSNDFDKDGIPNLLEFAFGLHPKQNSAGLLPKPQSAGGNLVITFTQPTPVSGITYGAEWSPTLAPGTWQPLTDTGTPPQHTFFTPIDCNMKKFVRLKVTVP